MRRNATHDDEKRSAPVVEAFADWERQFDQWLMPFLDALRYPQQRAWAPVYLKGLVLTEDRKSIQPLAARMAPADYQQLHHFVCTSPWRVEPLERVLTQEAQRLVGGAGAVLIIDDTGLPKQGTHSVGVARQYCGALGKIANCQTLVSLTLARGEVPAPRALRLFLRATWTDDSARCHRAGVSPEVLAEGPRTKWQVALTELDRAREAGVTFDTVLADGKRSDKTGGAGVNRASREQTSTSSCRPRAAASTPVGATWRVSPAPAPPAPSRARSNRLPARHRPAGSSRAA